MGISAVVKAGAFEISVCPRPSFVRAYLQEIFVCVCRQVEKPIFFLDFLAVRREVMILGPRFYFARYPKGKYLRQQRASGAQ